jgi:hypothetical protein
VAQDVYADHPRQRQQDQDRDNGQQHRWPHSATPAVGRCGLRRHRDLSGGAVGRSAGDGVGHTGARPAGQGRREIRTARKAAAGSFAKTLEMTALRSTGVAAGQPWMLRQIDLAHAAGPQPPDDGVSGEHVPLFSGIPG